MLINQKSKCIALFVVCVPSVAAANIGVSVVSQSVYSADTPAMDMVLGIDASYTTIPFESGFSLPPAISIEVAGSSILTTQSGLAVADEVWDGKSALWNADAGGNDGRDVEFIFSLGTNITRFGVGISHLEQSTSLIVNGNLVAEDVRDLSNWTAGGPNVRNGYLWIDATDGEFIQSVLFDGPNGSDTVFFDHVAYIPAPGSAFVFLCAGLSALTRRR